MLEDADLLQEQPLPLLLQDVPQVKLLGQQALLRVWQQEQVQLWVRQAEVLFEGPLEQKRQLSLRLKPERFSSPQSFLGCSADAAGAVAQPQKPKELSIRPQSYHR